MMRKALVVGINDYPSYPLNGCVNDAAAFANTIERNGDGSPNFSVRLETNIGTKAALKKMFIELFEGDNDISLLYFSGHGYFNDFGGYVVTPDAQDYDEGVSMDDILVMANNSNSKERVIILDCCNSGAMGSPASTGSKQTNIAEGVIVLTASKVDESAVEVNGHGVFTNLLIDALQGGAADLRGHVTPGSVYAYIDQALGPWYQRPVFKTNVTRFTSLRNLQPQVPQDVIRKIIDYFLEPEQEFALDRTYEYTNEEAIPENVAVFKNLQKMEGVGLVIPVDEEHMYDAAQNSKSCKLTALGLHYWRLVNEGRF
ncbi:MAG: peptidase C14 [Candidatus Kerfeldbacteria bacterium CG15_BIG_FIL_POST_REV_8_21_14_020_45_12]|uniref:Peptidase C14 n=1 Tax=Candidatus Kerfeldbacteria bacterium CG15_BIG_FIL_POST_REV_8_21_14_020_45_12 TaxID=2014247 RepID=A0A2M7H2V9_9BACT|nr:MAG: peptidase C14 [Candidatus Kerfeldbacteria bacterium CG15_BIG_FIL_POST_REV_8_21_14_020_45_12]